MADTDPPSGSWFERGPDRTLSDLERQFVSAFGQMMQDLSPAQVDPSHTAITGEGADCLILLIPHRCLGGLTLVVNLLTRYPALSLAGLFSSRVAKPRSAQVTICWADVFNLSYHDDLDLGHAVSTHFVEKVAPPDFRPTLKAAEVELTRPLVLRIWEGSGGTPAYAECRLGNGTRIARFGKWPRSLKLFPPLRLARPREEVMKEVEVRFVDAAPPPFTQPSYAPLWFESESNANAMARALDPDRQG